MVMPLMGLPAVRRISFFRGATRRACQRVSPGALPGGMLPVISTAKREGGSTGGVGREGLQQVLMVSPDAFVYNKSYFAMRLNKLSQ